MEGGVELLARRVERLDAVAREHGDQLGVHELHAVEQVLLALLRGLERALEVVDHRQQLADQPALGALAGGRDLLGGPLAVVLEVRLSALSESEVVLSAPPQAPGSSTDVLGPELRLGLGLL